MPETQQRRRNRPRSPAGHPRRGTRGNFRLMTYFSLTALLILSIPGTTTLVFASAPSFSSVINLSNNQGTSSYPQIATSAGYQYVVWQDNSTGSFNILIRASFNNGASFGPVINLDSLRLDSTIPQVAATGNNVYVVWQQASTKNT